MHRMDLCAFNEFIPRIDAFDGSMACLCTMCPVCKEPCNPAARVRGSQHPVYWKHPARRWRLIQQDNPPPSFIISLWASKLQSLICRGSVRYAVSLRPSTRERRKGSSREHQAFEGRRTPIFPRGPARTHKNTRAHL